MHQHFSFLMFLNCNVTDAVMALGMILLNERFSLFEHYGMQKVAPMIGLAIVVLDFGYLLSIFRMKYHGYPYRCVGLVHGQLCNLSSMFLFHPASCSDESSDAKKKEEEVPDRRGFRVTFYYKHTCKEYYYHVLKVDVWYRRDKNKHAFEGCSIKIQYKVGFIRLYVGIMGLAMDICFQ